MMYEVYEGVDAASTKGLGEFFRKAPSTGISHLNRSVQIAARACHVLPAVETILNPYHCSIRRRK